LTATPLVDTWLSINLHIHMRGRRLSGDVGLRRVITFVYFSLLHHLWYGSRGSRRCAVPVDRRPSNDIHTKSLITVCTTAGCCWTAAACTAQQPWTLPMSSSLLNITVGAPIMLLQNMDRARGHGNGMRYVLRQVSRWYIEAEIACGEYTSNVLFILWIPRRCRLWTLACHLHCIVGSYKCSQGSPWQ